MTDNPKPQTYGAAMRALEGSQAALTEALAELTTAVAEVDRLRWELAELEARHTDVLALTAPLLAERGGGAVKTIYLVTGHSGEYDDHQTWLVVAYTERAAAESHAVRASQASDAIERQRDEFYSEHRDELDVFDRLQAMTVNEHDPGMVWGYPRPCYDVAELELRGAL